MNRLDQILGWISGDGDRSGASPQLRLVRRMLWLLIILFSALILDEAYRARPALPLHLAFLMLLLLGPVALSFFPKLAAPFAAVVGAAALLSIIAEAQLYDMATPSSLMYLVVVGPVVTLLSGPALGMAVTLGAFCLQLWLMRSFPPDSARALRTAGDTLVALAWAESTALVFQRSFADLQARLAQERAKLGLALAQGQLLAHDLFEGLQVPLLALELKLAETGAPDSKALAGLMDTLKEQLQAARERSRDVVPPVDGGGSAPHLQRLRRSALLAQLWAAWAAMLASAAWGVFHSDNWSLNAPSAFTAVALGVMLLVFGRRISSVRQATWAAALVFIGLLLWSLRAWGMDQLVPGFVFVPGAVLALGLLDGWLLGTMMAGVGALLLMATAGSPLNALKQDGLMDALNCLVFALFLAVSTLGLHQELTGRLEKEREALRKALRLRRRLLGTLVHDLANPLGILDLLIVEPEQPLLESDLPRLQSLVERMGALIRTASDFVAVDGRLPQERLQSVELAPLMAELRAQFLPRLEGARQELKIYCPPSLRVRAVADILREGVLAHLLKLAQGRCPRGARVTLSVTAQGDRVALRLQDPGAPLTPDALAAPGRFPDSDEGPAMTLALVQEHLARMGGNLDLVNEPGGGSTATVWLVPPDPA